MSYPFLGMMGLTNKAWHHQKYPVVSSGGSSSLALLEYLTTSNTSSFTLLSVGLVDYEVDWGDGTTESLTTNNPTHTYSSAGEYTIKVTPAEGSTYRPYFNNSVSDTSIASVSGAGGSQLGTNLSDAWEGASNMTSFRGNIDTSGVINFDRSWQNCSGLTSFPQLNVSSGTNFIYSWRGCTGLTSFPLLNVSSGTNFARSWNDCSGLTSFPQLDTSSGTNFSSTWRGCSGLISFPQLDVSSGTDFSNTWRDCSGLTSFPQLDTSSGTNFGQTWRGCTGLTSFPLLNVSSGFNFYNAWYGCSGLTSFPQLDVSSGTDFRNAWNGCSGLTSFPANVFDTTATLSSTAFRDAWLNCALTVQSIENILVSLDTNGQTGITLGINGGTNAGYSTWTAAAQTALTNLQGKGWTITYNS